MRGFGTRERAVRATALILWIVCIGAGAVSIALARGGGGENNGFLRPWQVAFLCYIALVGLSTLGSVKLSRAPRDSALWLLQALALTLSFSLISYEYVQYGLTDGSQLAGASWVALAGSVLLAAVLLSAPFVLLLAPEDRWRSRGWRRFTMLFAGLSAVALIHVTLGEGQLWLFPSIENPLGMDLPTWERTVGLWIGIPAAAFILFVGAVGFPREGPPDELDYVDSLTEYNQMKKNRKARKTAKMSAYYFVQDLPRVIPYVRPYWFLALTTIFLMGVTVLVALLAPIPLAIILDTVVSNPPAALPGLVTFLEGWTRTQLLVFGVVAGLIMAALSSSIGVLESYVQTRLELKMELDVRGDLFEHAHKLSHAFHDKQSTGMLMFRINNQAGAIGEVVIAIPNLLTAFVTLVGMFVIAFKVDPELALVALTVVPLIYFSTGYYAKTIQPRLYYVAGLEGRTMTIIYEAIAMLRVIVAFGREKHEFTRFREQGEEAVKARVGLTVRQTLFSLAVNVITAFGTALVLGLGAWHVIQGKLSVGELTLVLAYIGSAYQPLEEISVTLSHLQMTLVNMQMALDLLDMEPTIVDAPNAVKMEKAEGRVTFESVSFRHAGRRRRALKQISFDAAPGSRVGLVGVTGAGKTTLISLIPRFYDVERGRVLIDGVDVREIALSSLRAQVSIVHQEPLLFSASISDNIAYGRLDATEEDIIESAKQANAHDFITRLPSGYKERLGEGGALLSGGERQRIAIARAFLKNAPILILDEPTAAIDSHTEAVILDALDRLAGERTTFTIAHRLSTLGLADLILVIDNGRVVESGTHDELIDLGGLYKRTYDLQRGPSLRLVPSATSPLAAGTPAYSGGTEPLVDALRLLLAAPPDELDSVSVKADVPLEVRLAAGMLSVLSREDREKLRTLGDADLAAMLDEVRP